ncbi:MAG: site-specific DNA-methyltransferase [Alphaproteobacteria bacterium]|jgi:site-specific DNA-methyltransferase (adenine-specific)|nr:site-specific DNA-methyltransferase [Alphaproteobacteria bacterium]
MLELNRIYHGDCLNLLKNIKESSIDLILSDIPYGISYDKWDVIHSNTNSSLLGHSEAQLKAGKIFKNRGKPLNGWSESDKKIPQEYYNWCLQWAGDWFNVLKPGASVFVFAGRRMTHRCISALEDKGFIFKDMIAWNKTKAPHRAQRISCVFDRREDTYNSQKWEGWKVGNLRPIFEPILWLMKPYKVGGTIADNLIDNELGAWNEEILAKYGQLPNNLISISSNKNDTGLHPTQKPLSLMELLIELTTKPNQIVLDPFCGSGTTLLAAKNLDRKFIGIEKEKEYYDIASSRIISKDSISNNIQNELFKNL